MRTHKSYAAVDQGLPLFQCLLLQGQSYSVFCICRQAKAHYEGELKLRKMNNDHVGAMEWEWVWSMLQSKQSSTAGVAQEEVLAKAQRQVSLHSRLKACVCFPTLLHDVLCICLSVHGPNRHFVTQSSQLCCADSGFMQSPVLMHQLCQCIRHLCILPSGTAFACALVPLVPCFAVNAGGLFLYCLTASCCKGYYCIVVAR